MAKLTPPTSYLTSDGSRIYPAQNFIYEVVTYKIYNSKQAAPSKGMAELVNSKFFITTKPLATLGYKVVRTQEYLLEQSITWVGAPMQFITDNQLPIYSPKKKKNEKGHRNVQKRKLR